MESTPNHSNVIQFSNEDHSQRFINLSQNITDSNDQNLQCCDMSERNLERPSENYLQDSQGETESIQHTKIAISQNSDLTSERREKPMNLTPEETQVRIRSRCRDDDDRFEQKELPKTINSVFGSIEDFLNFFVKRNPDIRDFAKLYKEIEETEDLQRLNTIICPEFAKCIHRELHKTSNSQEEANPAILFEKEFLSFDQFYAQVLRAYTMSSFLYRNLNKYLRNEDWSSFNNLLPYAFGLCRTFFCQHFTSDLMKHSQIKTPTSSNVILYRGAAFDEYALGIYDPEILKNFSWYSVTSTTTNLNIAKRFMGGGKPDPKNPKIPVLFMIEVSLMNFTSQKYLSYLDMRPFSEYQTEDEVILPPGSVFTLQAVESHKDGYMIIKLKLISDVGALSHEGLIMPGAMQSKMMTETEAKIMCMDDNDLTEALRHVKGNNLIQEIEFCLCKFDADSLRSMAEILSTMNAIKRLKFVSCSYDGNNFENQLNLNIQKIEIVELDQHFYKMLFPKKELWNNLISLDFAFVDINKVTSQDVKTLCTDGLQNLPQLQCLSLDFNQCRQFTDQDMTNLCSLGLKNLTKLHSLNLNFAECKDLTDSSLMTLSTQGLQPLLISLTLNFKSCRLITDSGISSFSSLCKLPNLISFSLSLQLTSDISDQSLVHLTSRYPLLANLALDLSYCSLITHKSLESLPSTLTSLKIHLTDCEQITDSSIISLSTSLLTLINLTSLDISLSICSQLTDQAISHFSSKFLHHLSSLTSLNLDLGGCRSLTDKAFQELALNGLKSLTKLTSLTLNFQSCYITNEGLEILSLTTLPNLSSLHTLNINLYWCFNITDEGLITLFTKGLTNLKFLTSLALNLSLVYELSDQGIHVLCSQGLGQLTCLQSLSINFSRCDKITDQGLQYLATEGLKPLLSLKSLEIEINYCSKITQEGADTLQAQISQHLLELTSTNIHFTICPGLSEKNVVQVGILGNNKNSQTSLRIICERNNKLMPPPPLIETQPQDLLTNELQDSLFNITYDKQPILYYPNDPKFSCLSSLHFAFTDTLLTFAQHILAFASQGLKYLTHLTALHIDVTRCQAVTDQIFAEFCSEGLQPLRELTSLTLQLRQLSHFTDQSIQFLCCQIFSCFPKMSSLSLELDWCEKITDQAIEILCSQGLEKFPLLKSLGFAFAGCKGITDQGLKTLGTLMPAQLTNLSLDFAECRQISDVGLKGLAAFNGTNLISLYLKISMAKVTNEGLRVLACEQLAKMSKLKDLGLDFGHSGEISDEGVNALCGEGLKKLNGLEKLMFDFEGCDLVTDVGVNNLCSQGLRHLGKLKEVKLNFEYCDNISEFTRTHIKKILQYFGFSVRNFIIN